MSILDGMHPTRAQVVPQGPSFTMRQWSVRLRTSRSAASPADPAPRMITSSGWLMEGLLVNAGRQCRRARRRGM